MSTISATQVTTAANKPDGTTAASQELWNQAVYQEFIKMLEAFELSKTVRYGNDKV